MFGVVVVIVVICGGGGGGMGEEGRVFEGSVTEMCVWRQVVKSGGV